MGSAEGIAFWGGLTSILSFAVLVFATIIRYVNKQRLVTLNHQINIDKALDEIDTIANEATTQGKRLDLFMYKESVLADARYQLTRINFSIVRDFILILALLTILLVNPMSKSVASYAGSLTTMVTSQILPSYAPSNIISEQLEVILIGAYAVFILAFIAYLFYNIFKSTKLLTKTSRRVSQISSKFIDSYDSSMSNKFSSNISLHSTIWNKPIPETESDES